MSNMRVAVVGGGVSGLAAAYVLAKEGVQVVVYEKKDVLGGHAKTAIVGHTLLDLGFLVFTRDMRFHNFGPNTQHFGPVMYPEVFEFFESVGVDTELTDMSLSVSLDEGRSEWGTRNGLSSLFAQKKNVLNPWFWKMIREITKFKGDVSSYLEELENNSDIKRNVTFEYFIQSHGYSELFQKAFLIPTCASMWSCSSELVMNFSAYFVLSVLCNHDVPEPLGHSLTSRWRSQSYVYKIMKELENRGCQVKTKTEVCSVSINCEGQHDGCVITSKDGLEEAFNGCIIALHAPDALTILGKQATYDETTILGAFQYSCSDIFIHRDNNLMPKNPAVWGSRNFLGTLNDKTYTTYWFNNLQNINKDVLPLFLTVNPPYTPKNTLYKCSTSHSIPSIAAFKASSELHNIQGKRSLWFCGSYQGYGFPEDGVKTGILAGHGLLRRTYAVQTVRRRMVPSYLEAGARVLVMRFLQQLIATGSLILLEEGGSVFTFEGSRRKSNLKVALRIHNPQFYWKVATEADLGFADAYINGDFSFVDKNEGLLNFFLIIIASKELNAYSSKLNKKRGWWTPMLYTSTIASARYFFKHVSRKNILSQARKNISRHYDLSNEMFSLFMDETMTYSCAIFKTPGEDLKDAQLRKLHLLIEKARINKEHHILEIGFGWGSLAIEVVKMTGCKYTGVTLSENQLQYAQSKVKEAGLQDHIDFLLCDYRKLPSNKKYDRIISCGMIEHVGNEFIEEFFKSCESALAQNGLLVLQFIATADDKYDESRRSQGFIKEYIFPGGIAPSLSHVISAMAAASRLSVVHLEEIGNNYFETLRHWRQNFLNNRSQVLALGFNEKFIRTWEYYFDYCAAGFKYCILGDYQIVFSRPGDVAAFGNDPYNPAMSAY